MAITKFALNADTLAQNCIQIDTSAQNCIQIDASNLGKSRISNSIKIGMHNILLFQ